ncbi:MAG TPA: hypothetical protein VE571_02660 [Solirubrobacteraceae bacterium]|jgi:hypothetical protein|nr:hypothetical protein [Solirubrobacteraceae bacterium]
MTRNLINRGTAAALTTAVVLGAAGPAAARYDLEAKGPVFDRGQVSSYHKANVLPPYTGVKVPYYGKANVLPPFMPKHMKTFPDTTAVPVAPTTPRAVVNRPAPAGSSDLVYVIVGGVVVAIGGLSGAFVAGRHHGARTIPPARPNVAG